MGATKKQQLAREYSAYRPIGDNTENEGYLVKGRSLAISNISRSNQWGYFVQMSLPGARVAATNVLEGGKPITPKRKRLILVPPNSLQFDWRIVVAELSKYRTGLTSKPCSWFCKVKPNYLAVAKV